MKEKQVVITGATGGIGYETARALAAMGASVSLVVRDESKGRMAMDQIRQDTGNTAIAFFTADISSQKQLRNAAREILRHHPVIDVLVNNAGTWYSDFGLTEDHIERMFAVNHLSYFLLTHCLLGGLSASSSARVINVSSDSHFHGKIHWDDLNLTRHYSGMPAYAQSKLANMLFTYEFVRRNPGLPVTMNAVHPGLVRTDIGIKHTNLFHATVWRLRRLSGMSASKGARTSIHLASSHEVEGITGKYWDRLKSKPSLKASHDTKAAGRLWDICEELCCIDKYFLPKD